MLVSRLSSWKISRLLAFAFWEGRGKNDVEGICICFWWLAFFVECFFFFLIGEELPSKGGSNLWGRVSVCQGEASFAVSLLLILVKKNAFPKSYLEDKPKDSHLIDVGFPFLPWGVVSTCNGRMTDWKPLTTFFCSLTFALFNFWLQGGSTSGHIPTSSV